MDEDAKEIIEEIDRLISSPALRAWGKTMLVIEHIRWLQYRLANVYKSCERKS